MEINAQLNLKAKIECERKPADGGLRKFRMIANTGASMFFGDDKAVAIDAAGVFAENDSIPIIYRHWMPNGIGHSTAITAEGANLIVEGVVSRETEYSRDFVSSSLNGFPWQASVGGVIREAVEVEAGEEYDLHGKTIKGPATIAKKFELYEVSVVEYGADSGTSSKITARLWGKGDMPVNNNPTPAPDQEKKNDSAPEEMKIDAERQSVDTEQIDANIAKQREIAAAEYDRIAEIKRRAKPNDDALIAQAIREGWTPDKFELESIRGARPPAPEVHEPDSLAEPIIAEGRKERMKRRTMEIVAMRAAGFHDFERRYNDEELSAADAIGSLDFLEFCERVCNAPHYSFKKSPGDSIKAALGTHNLGSILTTNANAMMLQALESDDLSWREIFKVSSVNDFKLAERWRMESDMILKKTPPGGEFESGVLYDEQYTIKAHTYGRTMAISYQDLVNGEAFGVWGEMLRNVTYSANAAITEECFKLFMDPEDTSNGNKFYSAGNGSLKETAPLTQENLSAAYAAFINRKRSKKASDKTFIGVAPSVLVVPTTIADKALMLTKATLFNNGAEGNNPANYNPNVGRFKVVIAPALAHPGYVGNSETTWYLLANPNRLAAFEIAFLKGRIAPTIRRSEFQIGKLGLEFDAHVNFGVAQEDYRGAMKITA